MNGGHKVLLAVLPAGGVSGALGQTSAAPPSLTLSATRDEPKPLDSAGWRRPLFLGVCDFPKGLVGVDGSSPSAGRTVHGRRVYPRPSLAGRESLREIADAKKRPSAPARDAAYLELALRQGLPLATLDTRLRHAARRAGVELFA